jgi:hypothetical protein
MVDHCLIATAADCQKGYYPQLSQQIVAAGIDFIYQPIENFSWRKLIDWEYTLCRSYPDALIAFCDTWDTLFQGTRKEFGSVISAQPLLFHSEKFCWPHPEKAVHYPACPTPWRYVNGVCPSGLGRNIANAIEFGLDNFPLRDDSADVRDVTLDNDQRFWTDVYLASRKTNAEADKLELDNTQRLWTDVYLAGYEGKLDSECRVSQSLVNVRNGELAVRGGRLHNKVTGTNPLFVHANGATTMMGQKTLMDMLSVYRPEKPW